jgi:hypothetical protein
MKLALCLLLLAGAAVATDRVKTFYKTTHLNQSVIGISCPGNGGDPTVIGNVEGTLLVSCGTEKP